MQELLPIGCGLVVGALAGRLQPTLRIVIVAVMAVILGVLATVVTGEFRISWAFVLIDIPLVGLSAAAALLGVRRMRGLSVRSGRPAPEEPAPGSAG
jgi:hypothetical protein